MLSLLRGHDRRRLRAEGELRRIRRVVAVVALATALCTTLSMAQASERLLILPVLEYGELNEAVADRLEVRLHEILQASDLELIIASEQLAHRTMTCASDDCRAQLVATRGAEFLLAPEIRFQDEDYQFRLTLYAASGPQVMELEDTCGLCGLAEAEDLMGDLGARMGRKIGVAMRAASAEILSTPTGAVVLVDGERVGTTPLELALDVGAHQLRVQLDGYVGVWRSIEVVAGESIKLDLGLQRLPPKSIDRKLVLGLGWSALALGAGTLSGGATLLVIHEQSIRPDCEGADRDADGTCRWRYATLGGGASFVAVGSVLIGAGVALLVVGRKTRESSLGVRVRPSAAGLVLEF